MRDLMSQLPQPMMERNGRMSGMAMRSIIALVDEAPDSFAALVDRIGTWDDEPGHGPYPLPRYQFALQEVLRVVNDAFTALDERGKALPNDVVVEGASDIVEQYVPVEHRQAVLDKMATFPNGTEPMDLSGGEDAGPVDFALLPPWPRGWCPGPEGASRCRRRSGSPCSSEHATRRASPPGHRSANGSTRSATPTRSPCWPICMTRATPP